MEMRRFDVGEKHFDATFFVSVIDSEQVDSLITDLKSQYPEINTSLLEQHNITGV
jgi:hypothetical protein